MDFAEDNAGIRKRFRCQHKFCKAPHYRKKSSFRRKSQAVSSDDTHLISCSHSQKVCLCIAKPRINTVLQQHHISCNNPPSKTHIINLAKFQFPFDRLMFSMINCCRKLRCTDMKKLQSKQQGRGPNHAFILGIERVSGVTSTDQRSSRQAYLLDLAHVHFVDDNSQTEKSTAIRRIGVRETSVFGTTGP